MRRGRVAALVAMGAGALLAKACASAPPALPTPDGAGSVVTRTFDDVTVHAVRTGWVRVKEAHRTLWVPAALRTPAILLGRAWTEWMPVTVYVVVHPEGIFLVDAGLSEDTLSSAHFDCDPGTHFVYDNLLKFLFTPAERIDRQLAALGLAPQAVRGVVFTHRHADHTDALGTLPEAATAYVGARDWPTRNGALACRWPQGRAPTLVDTTGPALGAFPHSTALTRDGRLAVVPMNGHSPGHLGVLLRTREADLVFAGDALFSIEQLRTRTLAGIVEDPGAARQTLEVLAAQLAATPTFLLPSHDPASLERFARGEVTR